MSKFFIRRPIFAIVIALIIVIVGIIAAIQLPIAQYPQISPPTVSVRTSYTGADALTVDETVAQIIERQVNGTQGMDYMSSNSDDTGNYRLTVTFEPGTDNDMDAVKVQNNVAAGMSKLPAEVQNSGINTRKTSNTTAMMIFLYSPKGLYDRPFMKNYADIYLLDKINRVDGVGEVQIWGADYSMRVWLNPDKLANLNLTMNDVTNAIRKQNLQAPAGNIGSMPAPDAQEWQYTGKIHGRLTKPEEFGEIVLKTDSEGNFVRLKDVARIETGWSSSDVLAKANGFDSVGFGIQLTSDANAIETVDAVKKIISDAESDFPPDFFCKIVVDNTDYIRTSIREVAFTFVEALILVVITVFVFLQSWRATIIPILAVPVSLIGTFAAFIVLNFSINTLTLFAMVLAIGLVVDDAIVVIENVENHIKSGLNPVKATEIAMDEVQSPVIAIAFVLAAVFVPAAFLGGVTGILYRQFALTIAISMALSAFVALSLTPALCAMILTDKKSTNRFFVRFNDGFARFKRFYLSLVSYFMRKKFFAPIILLIICISAAFVYKNLPSTFVPSEDQGFFTVSMSLPEGTSANHTRKSIDKIAEAVGKLPGVANVVANSGFDILSSGSKSNSATMFVRLVHWDARKLPEMQIEHLINATRRISAKIAPEAQVTVFNPPVLPGLGRVGGWNMQLLDMSGHSDEELHEITDKIVAEMNKRLELQGVRSTYRINSPIYDFEIDRDKVNLLGIDISDVFTAMQINFGGYQVNDFNQFGRSYKVILQSDMLYRSEIDALKFIFVKNSRGEQVPLDTLIKPRRSSGISIISRFNGTRSVTIQGNSGENYSSGQAIAAAEEVVRQIAPTGFNIEWTGQSREEKKASNSAFKVLLLSILFVFLCLAALYESWSVPFAVLLTVPVGIGGAIFSEYFLGIFTRFFGHYNDGLQESIYMHIGILMLVGLAVKNAILIVEFAKIRVDRGVSPIKATLKAAELRLRPILMTSFAFIIGCLPLVTATGAGAAARNSMGTAVSGGMFFATFLGIFLTPIFFLSIFSRRSSDNRKNPELR